ncbi:amidohydrolase family protein [Frankia sp. AgB1.9]|uniref:N-acyl-D-amino-acid deacylase family protein n=1 Tax=unclassified Frankia TaxID=2632575 RepID=UPI0019330772|nr:MULTISPECIES: amidohydrolase family protein [unclassified Frankia]MBL7489677.1 amidohydrolase family protein [Frankia sp. AgW1.1]MBL7550728.1 amidohydrolase family protein [Frankia sp. AgB1.9]MBL7624345.1 amidohydrolase family protein [Frankia sp. AgB1.8]
MSYDIVLRGGTVIDGSGAAARTADVAIRDGLIVEVGAVDGRADRELEVSGALVIPGFVDVHTHYDGQATWDSFLQPSAAHGVTTAVMGNCGVGFAPVRRADRDALIELMEGVEDLPGTVLHEGLPWTWESIEEYLDALDSRPHDIDFATQVCHSPVRLYVMGQRGADREPATPDDIAEMGRITAAGIRAGALGFSTSRTVNHRTSTGAPAPSLDAARAELVGIAQAMGATGQGVLQVVSDFTDFDDEIETLYAMMRASGRPMSVSLSQKEPGTGYRETLRAIEQANADGLRMTGVVPARAIGVLITLDGTVNPWATSVTFRSGADLKDPAVKATILAETETAGGFRRGYDRIFELGDRPDYEPAPSASIAARAQREGRSPDELLYDVLLRGPAYMPVLNYFDGNLDPAHELLAHPHTIPGLGDGGAHVGTISDGSFPTTLLAHWGRDRDRGPRFELPWLVARQCRATAQHVGLTDRGLLAPGYKADVNVIDFDRLAVRPPHIVADLPAGGRRVMQEADGYLHTFVSGTEVYTNGTWTGRLPGRLVRGTHHPAG